MGQPNPLVTSGSLPIFIWRTVLLLICCQLLPRVSGAAINERIAYSGNGIEASEAGVNSLPCDVCLDEIISRLAFHCIQCSEVEQLTECFQKCIPQAPNDDGNGSIRQLLMLTQTSMILTLLKTQSCTVEEEQAPGCTEEILDCLQPVISRNSAYPFMIRNLNCSDEAMISLLTCTAKSPDCAWRDHIETIASRGRRGACGGGDSCVASNILFIAGPKCKTYRMTDINNVASALTQPSMRTAPGTLFDTSICGLRHRAVVDC
ncbi:uncharacterized protein [Watersipora subatra]|uniref:uncharacterized protein n=1 Tax=Watersipora subatra TaxID=2589382 RepID=UPI00355B209C